MLLFCFLIHFEGFAVQETMTTPLMFDFWDLTIADVEILFVCAGVGQLLCFVIVTCLSKREIREAYILFVSLGLGFVGYVLLIQWEGVDLHPGSRYSLVRFLIGYTLIAMAFPLGRAVCISMYSNVLGPVGQGQWMGIIFTVGAISRILAPIFAAGMYNWLGPTGMYGSSGIFFGIAFIVLWIGYSNGWTNIHAG